jgi:hypothetical protein
MKLLLNVQSNMETSSICATLRNLKAKVNAQIDKADDRKEMLLKTSNKQ